MQQQYYPLIEQSYTFDSDLRRQLFSLINKDCVQKTIPKIKSQDIVNHFYPLLSKYLISNNYVLKPRTQTSTLFKNYVFTSPNQDRLTLQSAIYNAFKNKTYNLGQKFTKLNGEIIYEIVALYVPVNGWSNVAVVNVHIPSLGIIHKNKDISAYSLVDFKES